MYIEKKNDKTSTQTRRSDCRQARTLTHQCLTKNLARGLAKTRRVYLMSLMMSIDQSMNSRSLLLGVERSTSYLNFSFTSSRSTFCRQQQRHYVSAPASAQHVRITSSAAAIFPQFIVLVLPNRDLLCTCTSTGKYNFNVRESLLQNAVVSKL